MDTSRFLAILENIDPELRRRKLEEEVRFFEERFLDSYRDVESQQLLLQNYKGEAQAFGAEDPVRVAQIKQVETGLRQLTVLAQTFADALEERKRRLAETKKAGLPQPEAG